MTSLYPVTHAASAHIRCSDEECSTHKDGGDQHSKGPDVSGHGVGLHLQEDLGGAVRHGVGRKGQATG